MELGGTQRAVLSGSLMIEFVLWLGLVVYDRLLDESPVDLLVCFFVNVFVGEQGCN